MANLDVLGVATNAFADGVAIAPEMEALNVSPRMVGLSPGAPLSRLYEVLGRDAEFVYGASLWLPELIEVRDLWHAMRTKKAARIAELEPLRRTG